MESTLQLTPSILSTRSHKDNSTTPIRVAIYGRISTEHEQQLTAFDNKMDWYSLLLDTHPNWQVVGVYSDKTLHFPRIATMPTKATKNEFPLSGLSPLSLLSAFVDDKVNLLDTNKNNKTNIFPNKSIMMPIVQKWHKKLHFELTIY